MYQLRKLNVCTIWIFTYHLNGTIILLVLYGCETWSVTLRKKRRLRVFENRMLRWVFGPKRDKVTGVEKTTQRGALWSVLLTKYYSGDQIRGGYLGLRGPWWQGNGEDYITRSFMVCSHQILFGWSLSRMKEESMWRLRGRRKEHAEFLWRGLREVDHLEDLGVGRRIIL